MSGAFRRGFFGVAFLGGLPLLMGVACSSGEQSAPPAEQQASSTSSLPEAARTKLGSLIGRATLPLHSDGKQLRPAARSAAEASPTLTMTLPLEASGSLRLHPAAQPERSLVLTPVTAGAAKAALGSDGSAVYTGAFGSADLVQSASLDGLLTQIAIHDGKSPDLFVWRFELGEGLHPQARDDLSTDLVDDQGGVWLSIGPATITDSSGKVVPARVMLDDDGYARLRVPHHGLVFPASVDFGVGLGGTTKALAITPTMIKGRVMVLLDSSGSMIFQFGSDTSTGGDSPVGQGLLCDNSNGGNPVYACNPTVACTAANGARPYFPVAAADQPSRMLAAKLAMQNVINANSGLLDFGLMRYAEAASCPNPLYCCNPQINGTTRGLCANVGEYTDVSGTGTSNDLSYNGSCGTPYQGGRVLVQPGTGSGLEILPWVDFTEDFCSSTGVVGGKPRNPELRGDGSTPLGRSIITARESWYRPVFTDSRTAGSQPLDDSLIDCRPYVLVVMTDGDDTCQAGTTHDLDCGPDAGMCNGNKCIDANTADDDTDSRCACSATAPCTGANQACNTGTVTQDCNGDNAACGSGNCIDTPGGGSNWRCACATSADCGTGLTCATGTQPEVDCRDDDARCTSGNCYDAPGAGTNWRCACNSDAQCKASEYCDVANNRCEARGVCQAAGVCEISEPLPRAQVQALTDVNTVNPVTTYVLGMGTPAGLNETELDAMAVAGGTDEARFASSQSEIEAAFADIVANTVKYEICNNADDNCNNLFDEGLGVFQECLTALDCNGGACNSGRCVCNGNAQCGAGYACSNETPTRFCRPSCSEGQGACQVNGVRKCGVGVGQCCVNNASATCTDITPPTGSAEVCNGLDDNCNGFIDENLPCQGCVPLPEVCNGEDDDCDGAVDEPENTNLPGVDGLVDVGGPCGSNVGRCTPGTAVCTNGMLDCSGDTGPFAEVCNGYDDDCDGVVDGMTRACYTGPANTEDVGICRGGTQICTAAANSGTAMWGTCTGQQLPTTEVCNGIDDNCDGPVDNGIPAPKPSEFTGDECCGDGVSTAQCGVGQCTRGTWACAGNVVVCANAGRPANETCDNEDNDCNGTVDNIPSVGGPCLAPGGCSGKLACDSQAMALVCVPEGAAALEVCDGVDNDCDGQVDEVSDLEINEPWFNDPCEELTAPNNLPPCQEGKLVCKNGVPRVCEGAVGPLPEVCDLKDTDCDGIADTLAACPGTNACVQGICVEPCRGGEFPCPGGYDCQSFDGKKYCVPFTCNDIECPPGASCKDGACTLDATGGAGNGMAGAPTGDAGEGNSAQGGVGNNPQGGEGNGPDPGGGTDSGGSAGSSNANAGTGNGSNVPSNAVFGLVTGGGGCGCRTTPVAGGKWAFGLSLLVLAGAVVRRRGHAKRRAA